MPEITCVVFRRRILDGIIARNNTVACFSVPEKRDQQYKCDKFKCIVVISGKQHHENNAKLEKVAVNDVLPVKAAQRVAIAN